MTTAATAMTAIAAMIIQSTVLLFSSDGSDELSALSEMTEEIVFDSSPLLLSTADLTLIITGEISDVISALTEIVDYFRDSLGYVVCNITKR